MKKVLVTVAALGLVAGVATTASAVEWKMSGKYYVEGYYMSDAREGSAITAGNGLDLTEGVNDSNTSDAWYQHTFEVNPTMKVNDKISMLATVRMADETVWGSTGDTAGSMSSNNDVYFHTLFMQYMSPIGEVRIGRHPAGGYGTTFVDTDSRQDRIMWWPSFIPKPWSVLLYTAKVTDNDTAAGDDGSNQDRDVYEARLNYKDEALDGGIRYSLDNNNTNANGNEKELYAAYAKYKTGNYFANVELDYYGGDLDTTDDYDSLGAMLEVGGKFGDLTVSGMYFYASGDDNNNDDDDESFMNATGAGMGSEFTPLYMLTGRTAGLLNRDQAASAYATDIATAGVHAFILAADYKVSNALTLHGAIGYAEADEATQTGGTNYAGRDDEYGWEYNIGAAYKLLDNLTYEAHFGYLDTGDFFKSTATTDDTENAYLLSHHLTMTF